MALGNVGGAYGQTTLPSGTRGTLYNIGQQMNAQHIYNAGPTSNGGYQFSSGAVYDPAAYQAAVQRRRDAETQQMTSNATNQYQNAYNFFANQAGYNPLTGWTAAGQSALNGLGVDRYGNVIGGANPAYGQAYINQQQYNLGSAGLWQQAQSNLAHLANQQANNQRELASSGRRLTPGGYYDQLAALNARELANQMAGFGINDRQAWQSAQTAQRGEISDATARGAVQAYGTREDMQAIADQLKNNLDTTNLGREGARISNQRANLSLQEQRAQDKDRQAALQAQAKDYGLDAQDFRNQLDLGLKKLGLDAYINSNQLMDAYNSASQENRTQVQGIVSQAMNYSNMFPSTNPNLKPSTGNTIRQYSAGGGARVF